MKNKENWLVILALVLAFGMMIAGCGGNDDPFSGGDGDDPIHVNLTLPSIQNVASFDGVFADSEEEQMALVAAAFEEIADLYDDFNPSDIGFPMLNRQFLSPSKSRAAEIIGPDDFTFDNETITDGLVMSGFFRISGIIDDDYIEERMKGKLTMDFDDFGDDPTINGRYATDQTVYTKMVSSPEPSMIKDMDINGGYALSVSKDGR
jgi:hypothetical protein